MTKQNAAKYIPLIQALAEGKTLQIKTNNEWRDMLCNIGFDAPPSDYRIKPQITNFETGDVFYSKECYCKVLIISTYGNKEQIRYYLAGFDGLVPFSDTLRDGFNYQQMLDFLNENGYAFIRNINSKIAELIKE